MPGPAECREIMNAVGAGFDERVDLESVRRNTQAIALFMADWCGLERT